MKVLFTSIFKVKFVLLVSALIFISSHLFAANPVMNLRFAQTLNNGTTYKTILQMECTSSGQKFNSGDFYFDFDPTSMSYSSTSFFSNFDPSTGGSGVYATASTTDWGASSGNLNGASGDPSGWRELQVSITNVSSSSGFTMTINTWYDVAELTFSVSSSSGSSAINWDPQISSGTDQNLYETNLINFDKGTYTNFSIGALPVAFINFSALLQNNETVLQWSTASEMNNAYFTIERSSDGKNFNPILTKTGAGNSQSRIDYTAYDESPLPGTSYYRIRQTDFNGYSETFKIVAIHNDDAGLFAINYVGTGSYGSPPLLNYTLPADAEVRMVVTNTNGIIMTDRSIASSKGENSFRMENTEGWKPGIYIVNLVYNGRSESYKFVRN